MHPEGNLSYHCDFWHSLLFSSSDGGKETIMILASDFAVLARQSLSFDVSVNCRVFDQYGYHPKMKVPMGPEGGGGILWKGTHERLFLFNSDAEQFILESANIYDIIFIDAYDGDDIFPHKLWDPHSPFPQALGNCLHPDHGTVVVNLHADVDLNIDASNLSRFPYVPMGQYVSQVSRSYKDALLGNGNSAHGFAYTVSVPWLYNRSLVVCQGFGRLEDSSGWNLVFSTLMSKVLEVDKLVNMPFSCLQYIKRNFTPED